MEKNFKIKTRGSLTRPNSCSRAVQKKRHVRHYKPPLDAQRSNHVLLVTLWFFDKYLAMRLHETRIKAGPILPGTGNGCVLPSVTIKFVYFNDKNSVYKLRKLFKRENKIYG